MADSIRAAYPLPAARASTSLVRDARGAILVPAIVMGAILVGALFYAAAAGDAIIFRTQLQDAADASAFTNAVWHARGMNIVAVINVLMSLILLVIVLFHVVELLCLLVAAVFWPAAPVALNVVRALVEAENTVGKVVKAGLEVLQLTQESVAVVLPYVGAYKAREFDRAGTATNGVMSVSTSLLPTLLDKSLLRADASRLPSDHPVPAALPAEADSTGKLCSASTLLIPDEVHKLIDHLTNKIPRLIRGTVRGWLDRRWNSVEHKLDQLASAEDGLLCQPVSAILSKLADESSDQTLADGCGNEYDEPDKTKAEQAKKSHAGSEPASSDAASADPPPDPTKRKKAVDGCSGQIQDDLEKSTEISAVPARIWDIAANGNVFTHTWSRATGQPPLLGSDRHFMSIAGKGLSPNIAASTQALAEAEFYFECGDKWDACSDDAAWAPGWTARMRRLHWPTEELGKLLGYGAYHLGEEIKDAASDGAKTLLADLLGKNKALAGGDPLSEAIAGVITDNVQKIPGVSDLFKLADEAIDAALHATGVTDLLNPHDSEPKRVH